MLERAEELDFQMLDGIFYTQVYETPQYIIAWHNKATDHYSNFAGRIRSTDNSACEVLDEIVRYFAGRKRNTSVLRTPFSQPNDFSRVLVDAGFDLNYKDVWMFYRGSLNLLSLDPSVSIETVNELGDLHSFVDTFNRAYSGTDPAEPYGQAPPEWGETFYSGFGRKKAGRKVDYYVLYNKGKPSSVLLTSRMEGFAGIYSVGTIPEMRGKGHGSTLTLYAVKQLREKGVKEIFLQTEKGSYNEQFYRNMGFSVEWEAESWIKKAGAVS